MKCGFCNIEGHSIRTCCATDCMLIVDKAFECLKYDLSINDQSFMFYKYLMSLEYTYLKMSLARLNRNKYADSFYHSTNRKITTLTKHEIVSHLVEDYFFIHVLFKQFQRINVNELEYYCNVWREIRLNHTLLYQSYSTHFYDNKTYTQKITEETNKHERFTDNIISNFLENEMDKLFLELTL
jgi:hypothetical protein